jgi:hypothetical protein
MRPRIAAFIVAILSAVSLPTAGQAVPARQLHLRAPTVDAATIARTWTRGSESAPAVAPGLPATVSSVSFQKQLIPYPLRDASGTQIGNTTWRVVKGTGNCCENHLGITKDGLLMDFGGAYLNISEDQGNTWKAVKPVEPLVGPEGTVAVAPGGDVVGVTWDPYSGDRLISFKRTASTGAWEYMYTPLHTPFYDREWIGVIPGPHTFGGQTVPYITVIRGGWPAKDVWYYSLDGLHYATAGNKVLTEAVGEAISEWLPTTANVDADWTQPISETGIAPLNGGGAIAWQVDTLDGFSLGSQGGPASWILKPGSLLWTRFRLGDNTGLPEGRLVMDSRGWAHVLNIEGGTVTYRLSKDGGHTWSTTTAMLPDGNTAENWDFHANGALGITAVAIHSHNNETNRDADFVLKFSTVCGEPELTRIYHVGAGDLDTSSGLGASIRFDFATMVIMPDGRIATSIIDAAHTAPALAVEVSTALNPGYTPPLLSCGVPAP